jgi:GAF domain-containing protein
VAQPGEREGGNLADLADRFTELGRDLVAKQSIDEVLGMISARAHDLVPAAEHAAVSRGRANAFETVASTSDLPPRVDQIQYDLHSGPCVDAVLENNTFRVGDLERTEKWSEFGRRAAAEYGIRSMLSIRIYLEDDDLLAGLNLYSTARDAFDETDESTATLLATHGGLAFTAARRQDKIQNLERALVTSRRIGVAIGILMARHMVTEEQAFDLMRIASQNSHRKLYDIADEVAHTGVLDVPALPRARARD